MIILDKAIYLYLACAAVLFGLVAIKAYTDRKTRKRLFYEKMKNSWGQASDRMYGLQEWDKLSHYFYLEDYDGFVIDDITWNDLDMDRVFKQMNHTCSSIGEEYLYAMLRKPVFDKKELDRRDTFIQYFSKEEKERLFVSEIFANIGRSRSVSVIGYLRQFEDLQVKNPWRYRFHQIALLLAAGSMFVAPAYGIMLLIAALGWNVGTYYKEKREIDVYLEAFSYIARVLHRCYLFEKVDSPFLTPYAKEIIKKADALKKFQKGRHFLKAGNDLSGGLEDVIMDYVRVLFHVDLQQFNKMLKELYVHQDELNALYESLGFLESMIAAAYYREFLGTWAVPEFSDKQGGILAKNLYHPLIQEPVTNSIDAKRGVLLTGSNASGKSTFLKTVAINALLSQTLYTAAAEQFCMPFSRIYTSMALQDNLEGEESYYIVEIKSLKRILDACDGELPVLCFVDEVLRGTNTVERIASSSEILKSFARKNVYCFAATHDIELTYLLEGEYDNYHFSEQIEKGEILFDYVLHKGRATSRNAIMLLEVIGYDKEIITRARERARHFTEHGDWK